MKTKFDIKSILCGSLLGAALVFTIGAATGATRAAWEYRVIMAQPVVTMEKAMNTAADEGWEVIGVASDSSIGAFTVFRRAKK